MTDQEIRHVRIAPAMLTQAMHQTDNRSGSSVWLPALGV